MLTAFKRADPKTGDFFATVPLEDPPRSNRDTIQIYLGKLRQMIIALDYAYAQLADQVDMYGVIQSMRVITLELRSQQLHLEEVVKINEDKSRDLTIKPRDLTLKELLSPKKAICE